MRVFAKTAFRYLGIDYPYGWQDLPQSLADTLHVSGKVAYTDNLAGGNSAGNEGIITNFPTLSDIPAGSVAIIPGVNGFIKTDTTSQVFVGERAAGNKIAILGNSIVYLGAAMFNGSNTSWARNTAKSLTNTVVPSVIDLSNGYVKHVVLTCSTAGTTGDIEPVWTDTVGATIADGSVVWTVSANTAAPKFSVGWWHIAQALSEQRLAEHYIAGLAGELSAQILKYVDAALAINPDIVFFANCFENDLTGLSSASAVISAFNNYKAAVLKCLALGKRVIIETVLPNGHTDASATFAGYSSALQTKSWHWLNYKIRELSRQENVILFDAALLYADPNPTSSSTNAPVWPENTATYISQAGTGQRLKKTDGVHPYSAASWLIGSALSKILSANFQSVDHFAVNSNVNAITFNPANYGASGTAGTGTITGTVPNLLTLNASGTTGAATTSSVSRSDMLAEAKLLQAVYTAGVGGDCSLFNTTAKALNSVFAVGVPVQLFSEITVLANPVALKTPSNQLNFMSGSTYNAARSWDLADTSDQELGQFITTDTKFTLKTPPVKIPPGTVSIYNYNQLNTYGAPNVTGQFGRNTINLVTLPDMT
jgi:hypothetical protein